MTNKSENREQENNVENQNHPFEEKLLQIKLMDIISMSEMAAAKRLLAKILTKSGNDPVILTEFMPEFSCASLSSTVEYLTVEDRQSFFELYLLCDSFDITALPDGKFEITLWFENAFCGKEDM